MTLDITQLEQRHHALYAPAFIIKVNGQDLLSQHFLEIASVQVDNMLEGADRFTFTINGAFDFERREFDHLDDLFAFGNAVEIRFGYQDISSLKLMHRGIVTGVQTSFPASGLPQITVSGYDLSYCMTKGKQSRNFDQKKDSEIASTIADEHGLSADVEDTRIVQPKTEQSQESDQQFLKKLAERNGYELFVFDRTLHFHPPSNDAPADIALEWGKGLVSFAPEINISEQVTTVEVRGWDVAQKKEFIGKARQGDEPGRDSDGRSGAEVMKSVCRDGGELKVRAPVFSQNEADQLAKAILKKRAETFVSGSGESIGLPEIKADSNIDLRGIGRLFSRTYYVQQATHTISTGGYRTTFKVKDTTI
jgi:uncharacterized protein